MKSVTDIQGVSEIVSALLALSIVTGAISTILIWGLPYIEETQMDSERASALSDFDILDNVIGDLILEGSDIVGLSNIVNTNKLGSVSISNASDKLIMMYCLNESFDFNISGLEDEDNEFYVNMSGGPGPPSNWYNDNWFYRRKIFINHTKVDGVLKNFPVLVQGYEPTISQEDGGDILFTDSTGVTKIPYELEYYDSGSFRAWVTLPVLSNSSDTVFYMYYHNPSCSPQWDPTNVWDSNYVLVQHLEESPDNDTSEHFDSTVYGNTGTPKNFNGTAESTTDGAGKIDGADVFDGYDDFINCGHNPSLNITSEFTIEVWVRVSNLCGKSNIISKELQYNLSLNPVSEDDYRVLLSYGDPSSSYSYAESGTKIEENRWYYIVGTLNNTNNLDVYVNGVKATASSYYNSPPKSNIFDVTIGGFNGTSYFLNGIIDEIRISNVARNTSWINTSFNSMNLPTFCIWGNRESYTGAPVAYKASIYWLNPGKESKRFVSTEPHHEKIYGNHWCAQSFKPQSFKVTSVQLYLWKEGAIASDLTVSIYDDQGTISGFPDSEDNRLGSVSVSVGDIPIERDWVVCDFEPDITLGSIDDTYYIVVNTSGGSVFSTTANCYMWCLYNNDVTPYGVALISSNQNSRWTKLEESDFIHKIFYSPPQHPTPKDNFYTSGFYYPGVTYYFYFNADDPQNDDIYSKVLWGDGRSTGWIGPYSSNITIKRGHFWEKPGVYTIRLEVMDINGNRNEFDAQKNITIRPSEGIITGVIIPDDWTLNLRNILINGNKVSIKYSLTGTLLIDLYSEYWPNYNAPNLPGPGEIPFGRIWVFDLGSLSYTSQYSKGMQQIIYENGGILEIDSTGQSSLKKVPTIFETNDIIAFRIIQIGTANTTNTGGYGLGTYRLRLLMKNSFTREPEFPNVYNLKIQIFGDNEELWVSYLNNSYDFHRHLTQQNTVIYNRNGKNLILDNSFIEVGLEGIQ